MNCLSFRNKASLYIDHQLDSVASHEFLLHLNSCRDCFRHVDEIRQTAQLVGQLGHAVPPRALASDIMAGLESRARRTGWLVGLQNFALYSRPRYVSVATSVIVTCLLFTSVLYDLKPMFRFAEPFEDRLVEALAVARPPVETLPSVQSANSIVELTAETYEQLPTGELFVVAEVTSEGRAKLIQVVDGPADPQLERSVARALSRTSFKPATKAGRPVNARMLLLVIQAIDVRG